MQNLGTVLQGSTVRFGFATAAADGGEENFSATIEQADFIVRSGGSALTLDASTITVTNVATGLYEVAIDLSNDADFVAGMEVLVYLDPNDETIDSQNVSAALARFQIETDAQRGARELNALLAPITIGASGNSTTALNLAAASIPDGHIDGELLLVYDDSAGVFVGARCSAIASNIATVTALDGGALPFTPEASTDKVYRTGIQLSLTEAGIRSAVGLASGDLDTQLGALPTAAEIQAELEEDGASVLDALSDRLTATRAGYLDLINSGDIGGIDVSELNQIVDDLINGGRIDLLIDAIKAVTDALTAAGAAKLALATAGIISGVAQTGTLSATQASTDLTGFADDELIGRVVVFTGGTAAGQASEITDYANTNGVLTFNTISTAPANDDPFIIV